MLSLYWWRWLAFVCRGGGCPSILQTTTPFLKFLDQLLPLELASFSDDFTHKSVSYLQRTTHFIEVKEDGIIV